MTARAQHTSPIRLPGAAFRSKKEVVLETLRNAITSGAIKPNSKLVIDDLASQLGVSAIPIREALQQLQAEGFVTIQPYVGVTVTAVESGVIGEVFELLEALETISGRAACSKMNPQAFAEMEAMIRAMDEMVGDLEAWTVANIRLHQFICDCANMPLVKSALTRVLEHWNRVRRTYLSDVFAPRVHIAQTEHWQIFHAMRGCDTAELERVVRAHNQAARAAYERQFQLAVEHA